MFFQLVEVRHSEERCIRARPFTVINFLLLLNVVTGIFCNSAIETTFRDPEVVVDSVLGDKEVYTKRIKEFFRTVDIDNSGNVTIGELEYLMQDEQKQAELMVLGLDIGDAWTLFKLIDTKKAHVIDIDSFVEGCFRLKGEAKGVDIVRLAADMRSYMKSLALSIEHLDRRISIVTGGTKKLTFNDDVHHDT